LADTLAISTVILSARTRAAGIPTTVVAALFATTRRDTATGAVDAGLLRPDAGASLFSTETVTSVSPTIFPCAVWSAIKLAYPGCANWSPLWAGAAGIRVIEASPIPALEVLACRLTEAVPVNACLLFSGTIKSKPADSTATIFTADLTVAVWDADADVASTFFISYAACTTGDRSAGVDATFLVFFAGAEACAFKTGLVCRADVARSTATVIGPTGLTGAGRFAFDWGNVD
jgi:hypothetical protein